MKKSFSEFKEFIRGKKTAVVGIGISNKPLISFLIKLGARVSAFDKKNENQLGNSAEELRSLGVKLVLGENYLDELKGYEVIFKTPSMRMDSPALIQARKENTYITSEMEEFIKYCPAKIYGITGSDGKTTTTTLVYNMLKKEGYKSWVGGNIGNPLFTSIEEIRPEDKVVLELSSFQLMSMDVSTDVALITNLSPNHLDIHKDFEEYVNSKKNIYKFQKSNDVLVLNKDNAITESMSSEAPGKLLKFSIKEEIKNGAYFKNDKLFVFGKEVCSLSDIKLMGMHNVENLLAAFCMVYGDVSIKSMKEVASTFTGVEHRCEFVREISGVKYYNDSIASSPTRTLAGLKAFNKKVILIAGGYDKNIPFEPLAEHGYDKIKTLILVGLTKFKINEAFCSVLKEKNTRLPIIIVDSFDEAVFKAHEIAKPGDIVILSPACASFDLFPNFEARGNYFKKIVNDIE